MVYVKIERIANGWITVCSGEHGLTGGNTYSKTLDEAMKLAKEFLKDEEK